jgi:hypothetical protein
MLTPTECQTVLRLELRNVAINSSTKAHIICYLEVTAQGLHIHYWHHEFYKRISGQDGGRAEWQPSGTWQVPLSPALASLISSAAMTEFWSTYASDIPVQPADTVRLRSLGLDLGKEQNT